MRAILFALACLLAGQARAETFRCLAESRPGFAEAGEDGPALALCRDWATRLRGPAVTASLILIEPDTGTGLPPADIAFVSDALLAEREVDHQFRPGAVVFSDPVALMVPASSPITAPDQLPGHVVCLMIGSPGQRALDAHFPPGAPQPARLGFREGVEMLDAYNVGRCDAVVAEQTALAEMREETGINRLRSRLLSPALGDAPIRVALPVSP